MIDGKIFFFVKLNERAYFTIASTNLQTYATKRSENGKADIVGGNCEVFDSVLLYRSSVCVWCVMAVKQCHGHFDKTSIVFWWLVMPFKHARAYTQHKFKLLYRFLSPIFSFASSTCFNGIYILI